MHVMGERNSQAIDKIMTQTQFSYDIKDMIIFMEASLRTSESMQEHKSTYNNHAQSEHNFIIHRITANTSHSITIIDLDHVRQLKDHKT